jgi:hypothetical protein
VAEVQSTPLRRVDVFMKTAGTPLPIPAAAWNTIAPPLNEPSWDEVIPAAPPL